MPSFDDDDRSRASLMHNEDDIDDEDLDAAFIQTNYRAPAPRGDAAGRARVGKSAVKSAAATNAKKRRADGATRTTQKSADDRPPRARRTPPDDS
jgi:hypothetical protein